MKNGRRDVLKMLAAATAGAVVTPMMTRTVRAAGGAEAPPASPWPYKKLDPDRVAERAYAAYYRGACCYATFEGIIGELREAVGHPYTGFPTEMMVFGEGGVAGISSLCGTLNGASSAIFLTTGGMDRKKRGEAYEMIRQVFLWYDEQALPSYRPKAPKFDIKTSVSHSPLCHVSVTRWCKETGFKSFSKERDERCAWLAASVAKYAAELLNSKSDQTFKPAYALSAQTQSCRSCHDQGGTLENSRTMMECGGCHFTGAKPTHP